MTDFKDHDKLNDRAIALLESGATQSAVDALRKAATEAGFSRVRGDDQSEIWESPTLGRINLWIDATEPGIEPGGLGFDDQHEWAEDD
jgi:hypothetical protein